jgi:hypothetical protein
MGMGETVHPAAENAVDLALKFTLAQLRWCLAFCVIVLIFCRKITE